MIGHPRYGEPVLVFADSRALELRCGTCVADDAGTGARIGVVEVKDGWPFRFHPVPRFERQAGWFNFYRSVVDGLAVDCRSGHEIRLTRDQLIDLVEAPDRATVLVGYPVDVARPVDGHRGPMGRRRWSRLLRV